MSDSAAWRLSQELIRLQLCLEIVLGSLQVANEKEADAPMSAASHRKEAMRAAQHGLGVDRLEEYSP